MERQLTSLDYGVILYTSLGLSGSESLIALAGWITFTAICIWLGNRTVDMFGRRPSLSTYQIMDHLDQTLDLTF